MATNETRWTHLDKLARQVDPACKVSVPKRARAESEARLACMTPEEYEAHVADTVAFLARMKEKRDAVRAAFYAELGNVRDVAFPRADYRRMRILEKWNARLERRAVRVAA